MFIHPRLAHTPIRWACAAAQSCHTSLPRIRRSPSSIISRSLSSSSPDASTSAGTMDADIESAVRAIHATPTKATIYVTGGASQALGWLMAVPGASNTVLEASVPYCRNSLVELLGQEPAQYCSADTAVAMAKAAYRRSAQLAALGEPILGIGASSALASEPPKRGAHRSYVAAHSGTQTWLWSLTLAKGARSRVAEDAVVSRLLIHALSVSSSAAAAAEPLQLHLLGQTSSVKSPTASTASKTSPSGPSSPRKPAAAAASTQRRQQQQEDDDDTAPSIDTLRPQPSTSSDPDDLNNQVCASPTAAAAAASSSEAAAASSATTSSSSAAADELQVQQIAAADPLQELLEGRIRTSEYHGDRVVVDAPRGHKVYLPGSFNPFHHGHQQLLAAAVAAAGPGYEGAFELSVGNADKGRLPREVVEARVAQFAAAGLPVVLTSAPLFTDKARLFPGSRFVVGYDTAIRMVMPKYYGDTMTGMLLEFERLRARGCKLLVAGRWDEAAASFKTLSDIQVPAELQDLFDAIPEDSFRVDVSSTQLRQQGKTVEALTSSSSSNGAVH